jgi:hypothetical protein
MTRPPLTLQRRLLAEADRPLSPTAAKTYLETPISDAEREDVLALRRWFTARYPTGAERLAYVRRAYLRWTNRSHQPRLLTDET